MSYTLPAGDATNASWVDAAAYALRPGAAVDASWVDPGAPGLPSTVGFAATLPAPVFAGTLAYDNRNPRRASVTASFAQQTAKPRVWAPGVVWADAARRLEGQVLGWQTASPRRPQRSLLWRVSARVIEQAAVDWVRAALVDRSPGLVHQAATRHGTLATVGWTLADVRSARAAGGFEVGRLVHAVDLHLYQQGRALQSLAMGGFERGQAATAWVLAPYQQAWPPRPGVSRPLVLPPVLQPRPSTTHLVFACPPRAPGTAPHLVFGRVCLAGLVVPVVVPSRRIYMVHNSVTLTRLPAGTEFHAASFTLDIDADSWTFGWSASLHSSARTHLVRSTPGERVEVQALINGQALRLVIDSVGRDRQFPTDRISVRGRGLAAELDDVALNFGNTAARTAQQLMADVLTVNGVPFGWTVDWQIQDWLVPAGVWLHQGSYISALQDIAGAAGAYLQPHFTDRVIRVLPRYAEAPWDWATLLTPDLELPLAATTLESTEEVIKPAYNRVFVGGVSEGVFGPVDRDGTAGDVLAPQVTHPLITAAEVHRQRGLAVLSDTGFQEHLTLKTLLLPEMGIVMPGKLVRYSSDGGPRLGLVRKTAVSMSNWPVMHQTLGVQTHVE